MIVFRTFCVAVLAALPLSSFSMPSTGPETDPAAAAVRNVEELAAIYRKAIATAKEAGGLAGDSAVAAWGEYVTASGVPFVAVVLYVSEGSPLLAPERRFTFFGIVEDQEGRSVASFEREGPLERSRRDAYFEGSLVGLPPGSYRGQLGLAEEGVVVALAETSLEITGPAEREKGSISSLILSNNVFALDQPQGPADPFAFGGVKVVPKADRTFRTTDELWYFFELRNPGTAEPAPPAEGFVYVIPPTPVPRLQVRVDLEGTDVTGKSVRMSAPLREAEPIAIKGVPGHYGVGSAVPLASFKAGEYRLTIKVLDTIGKASYTLSEAFKIVE